MINIKTANLFFIKPPALFSITGIPRESKKVTIRPEFPLEFLLLP
jgi:hypothetical protein